MQPMKVALTESHPDLGGAYRDWEKIGLYWTNTSAPTNDALAYYRSIAYTTAVIGEFAGDKRTSFAVRCV